MSTITLGCKVLTFEMKGSGLYRKILKNARFLKDPLSVTDLQVELMTEESGREIRVSQFFKRTFRDGDFYESLGKLDVTNEQAQNVLSQIQEDLSFLVAHSFFDYNLKLKIIYKPCGRLHLMKSQTSEKTFEL